MAEFSEQEIDDAFKTFDSDESGKIDVNEVIKVLKLLCPDDSDDKIEARAQVSCYNKC